MFSTPTPKLTGINFYVPVNPSTYGGGRGCTLGGHFTFRIFSLLRYVVDIGKSITNNIS